VVCRHLTSSLASRLFSHFHKQHPLCSWGELAQQAPRPTVWSIFEERRSPPSIPGVWEGSGTQEKNESREQAGNEGLTLALTSAGDFPPLPKGAGSGVPTRLLSAGHKLRRSRERLGALCRRTAQAACLIPGPRAFEMKRSNKIPKREEVSG